MSPAVGRLTVSSCVPSWRKARNGPTRCLSFPTCASLSLALPSCPKYFEEIPDAKGSDMKLRMVVTLDAITDLGFRFVPSSSSSSLWFPQSSPSLFPQSSSSLFPQSSSSLFPQSSSSLFPQSSPSLFPQSSSSLFPQLSSSLLFPQSSAKLSTSLPFHGPPLVPFNEDDNP
jgi:hypothetical protein